MSGCKNSFPKSKNKLLIELVRTHPILYDFKHELYRNRAMKQKIWDRISVELDFPVEKTKQRWSHIRCNYMKNISGTRNPDLNFLEFLAHSNKLPRKAAAPASPKAVPAPAPVERVVYVVPPGEYNFPETEGLAPVKPELCASPEPPREAGPPERGHSVVHKYFESMADVVAQLPVALEHEACQRIYQLVTELKARALASDA